MSVQLNKLEEEVYRFYHDYACKILPWIYGEGRDIMDFSEVVKRRLDVLKEGASKEVIDSWWEVSFSVGDLFLRHPNGKGKIVLYDESVKELLKGINENTKFLKGKIILSQKEYRNFEGFELTKSQIKRTELKPISNRLTGEILKFLIRDKKMFMDYVEESKKTYPNSPELLGFGFMEAEEKPVANLWHIGSKNSPKSNLAQYSKYVELGTNDGFSYMVGASPFKK